MNEKTFQFLYFFQSKFHLNFFVLSLPQESCKRVSVHISFERNYRVVNVAPPFWPFMAWKTYPKKLDILTLEFCAILEHPPVLPECMRIRRQLLVHHSLVAEQWHPLLLRQWLVTQMSLVQYKTAWAPESSFTISPSKHNTSFVLLELCSNSAFLKWQMSINEAKWTLFWFFGASWTTSFLLLTLANCHAGIVSSFFHSLSTGGPRILNFHLLRHWKELVR